MHQYLRNKAEVRTAECGPCTWFNYCSSFLWLHIYKKGKEWWTCGYVKLKEFHFLLLHFHTFVNMLRTTQAYDTSSFPDHVYYTVGSVGQVSAECRPIISANMSTDTQSILGQQLVDHQLSIDQHISQYRIVFYWVSLDSQSKTRILSTDVSADIGSMGYRSTVGGLSVWCRRNLKYLSTNKQPMQINANANANQCK